VSDTSIAAERTGALARLAVKLGANAGNATPILRDDAWVLD
jgi:hypothetical protein